MRPGERLDMRIDGLVRAGFEDLSDDDLDARLAELRSAQAERKRIP
jgi:hypothetical protein